MDQFLYGLPVIGLVFEFVGYLIAVPPGIDGIPAGLAEAVAGANDYERRIAGAEVEWSRDWDQSFDPATMAAVVGLLDEC